MSAWSDGALRPGSTCSFCLGRGAFFHLRNERPAWRDCRACDGQGSPAVCVPAEMRIGAAQGRFLKPYPATPES
ncbi:hypothetical protein J2W76_003898 [Methylorubrum zatmanii]|nr:hypothetical protein [Methylorubrum zatmanii]MCP1552734.1 hypothetical protein [Methylorubrum extorquens]MCP1580956.1 hypothetical protein [Methylorubrum extorquens]